MVRLDKWLAKKWPSTYSLMPLFPVGLVALGIYVAANNNTREPTWIALTTLIIALVCLLVPPIAWVLELLESLFPKLGFISNILRTVVYKPYVWLIKLIIKPAVAEIVQQSNQDTSITKEQIFEGIKDIEPERVYDIQSSGRLQFSFKPESDYWRFGFRMSGHNNFSPSERLVRGVALFHFYKDENSKELKSIYYNHNGQEEPRQTLSTNYNNEEIEVHIDQKNGLRIVAKIGSKEIFSARFDFNTHKYFRVRAWSDNGWPYRIVARF